jgi:hypothetical protein
MTKQPKDMPYKDALTLAGLLEGALTLANNVRMEDEEGGAAEGLFATLEASLLYARRVADALDQVTATAK